MEASPTPTRVVRVSSLAFCCSHGNFSQSAFNLKYQTILVLSSVELTSILVVIPLHRLRITVILGSGHREIVEGLFNVHSSSRSQQ